MVRTHIDLWQTVAMDLGLDVEGPIAIKIDSGHTIDADVLVKGFGGPRGMIVVAESEKVGELHDHIISSGYGYSVFEAPGPDEVYDRSGYIELLSDWSWAGPPESAPEWYTSKY